MREFSFVATINLLNSFAQLYYLQSHRSCITLLHQLETLATSLTFLFEIRHFCIIVLSTNNFFKYNNHKYHIINNKSDKSKILNLQMTARHCQWRGANASLLVASLLKRVTDSNAFVSYKYQPRRYLSVCVFIKPDFRQTCHCQWRVSVKNHWQWRVYTNTPLTVARLLRATSSGALPFIDLKFYFYHFYY
jgi:hypothetical protein